MTTTVTGLDGGPTSLSDDAVEQLRSGVRGEVLSPTDPGYEDARPVFNAMHPGQPGLAVRCSGTADVVEAVKFAKEHGLLLVVRGGGHSIGGLSAGEGGLLIDLSLMDGVQVDVERRLARVQGGALWGDVDRECQLFGLATPGGVVSDTGVGGLTLGGGYGWLRRKHGLSCDNVVEAQVVCADGQVRTASADSNPDLYWAIRGGGGNFGVVTALRFHARPLGAVLAVEAELDPERLGETLRALRDAMADAPDELNVTFGVVPNGPPGPDFAFLHHIAAVYAGEDSEVSRAAIAPLLELPGVVASTVHQSDYRGSLAEIPGAPGAPLPNVAVRDAMLAELDDATIDDALSARAQLGLSVFTVRFLGGAFGRVDPAATAFAHRDAVAVANIVEFLPPGAPKESSQVDAAWAPVKARSVGSYSNFTEQRGPGVIDAIYPAATLQRLRAAKTALDPKNRFADNHNIAPA